MLNSMKLVESILSSGSPKITSVLMAGPGTRSSYHFRDYEFLWLYHVHIDQFVPFSNRSVHFHCLCIALWKRWLVSCVVFWFLCNCRFECKQYAISSPGTVVELEDYPYSLSNFHWFHRIQTNIMQKAIIIKKTRKSPSIRGSHGLKSWL